MPFSCGLPSNPCTTPNITTLPDMFIYANSVTGSVFGIAIIFMVFFIAVFSLRNYKPRRQIPTACFITLGCAVLLSLAGIIDQGIVYIILVLTIASTVILNVERE